MRDVSDVSDAVGGIAPLAGRRILVTGATGWVGGALVRALVGRGNEVFGAARFADPATREPLEAAGVRTVSIDVAEGRFDELPDGIDLGGLYELADHLHAQGVR